MRKGFFKNYESDASRMKGKALGVVHPRSVREVCDFVFNNNRIVIRGAGTGLAGGAVPQEDVVLDLSKLTKISNFDKDKKTVEVEAGVVLDDLQHFLAKTGLEFPVKPSSHAIASLGGMIATNAVGNRAVKYGKTEKWVKWIEVVDDYGKIKRRGMTELSDYIGMEGITGVIVRACLKLSPIRERSVSLFRLENMEEVINLVHIMKRRRDVSALEFFDRFVSEGIGYGEGYHLLVEYESDNGKLKGKDYEKIVRMRDAVYPFLAGEGYVRIEDPKVLSDRFPKLISWLEARGVPVFGHIGIGIFHPCFNDRQEKLIPEMMKLVGKLGGQVSGEHGIGLLKRNFVDINDQKILRNVKKRTDPMGKFNQGKVI